MLGMIRDGLKKNPTRWTKQAEALQGMLPCAPPVAPWCACHSHLRCYHAEERFCMLAVAALATLYLVMLCCSQASLSITFRLHSGGLAILRLRPRALSR